MQAKDAALNGYEFNVCASDGCQDCEVVGVRREDLVAIAGEEHHSRIDHVADRGPPQQHASAPAQVLVNGDDFDAGEQPSDVGLPMRSAAPHLTDDSAVRQGRAASEPFTLDQGHHLTIATPDSDERTSV